MDASPELLASVGHMGWLHAPTAGRVDDLDGVPRVFFQGVGVVHARLARRGVLCVSLAACGRDRHDGIHDLRIRAAPREHHEEQPEDYDEVTDPALHTACIR